MPILTPQQTNGPDGDTIDTDTDTGSDRSIEVESAAATASTRIQNLPVNHGAPDLPTGTTVTLEVPRRRRRRGRLGAVVGVVALAAAGAGSYVVTTGDDAEIADTVTDGAGAPRTIRTAEAEQRDLAEFEEVDGEFTYRDSTAVSAAAAGTITSIADVEDRLERGDTAYELDTVPVVVLWGDTPMYRRLDERADEGRDVRLLEENLAALGYTALGTLVVDDEYDDATTAAVENWETDIGAVVDGAVDPNQVVVLDGPAVVDSVNASLGGAVQAGTPVMDVRIAQETTTVLFGSEGRITQLPQVGDSFQNGQVAYELDTVPTPVIVGDLPLERELSIDAGDGDDVEQLETALVELGYDDEGELEVDDVYDESTANAVSDWEEDLGLETVDGIVQLGQYVVVPAGSSVIDVELERGDDVVPGLAAFVAGITTRTVTGSIDSADDDLLSIGAAVTVTFPDGSEVAGTISDIASSTSVDPTDPEATSTTSFEVSIAEIPESAADRDRLDVEINVTSELAAGATVVPASALVSVGDGSYAVEVVDGSATRFVAVEPGLFADGFVAVEGIEPGTAVVVPE